MIVDFETNAADLTPEQVAARLAAANAEIKQMQNPHARVATFLDQWNKDNFRSEGGHVGGWEPFAFGGRIKSDGDIDFTAKLLQDTGKLRASFVPFASRDNAGIGSDLHYSKYHEEGEGVPQRRMLPEMDDPAGKRNPGKTVRERVREIFRDHVVEILASKQIKVDEE